MYYNCEGLRSEELKPISIQVNNRVLCVGDSVTNGGSFTDQVDTYPYQLEKRLLQSGRRVQVLNASAGGWAIENELNYLRAKGVYSAKVVILQVGSGDLYQRKNTRADIENDPSFPTAPPLSAMTELISRYLLPRVIGGGKARQESSEQMTESEYQQCRVLLERMVSFVRCNGAIAVFLLMPDQNEAVNGKYEHNHISNLRDLCQLPSCVFVDALTRFHDSVNACAKPYRDEVHPNEIGNRIMAEATFEATATILRAR